MEENSELKDAIKEIERNEKIDDVLTVLAYTLIQAAIMIEFLYFIFYCVKFEGEVNYKIRQRIY
jgi:hypothetical protein